MLASGGSGNERAQITGELTKMENNYGVPFPPDFKTASQPSQHFTAQHSTSTTQQPPMLTVILIAFAIVAAIMTPAHAESISDCKVDIFLSIAAIHSAEECRGEHGNFEFMDAPGILAIVHDEGAADCVTRLGKAGVRVLGNRVFRYWKRDVRELGLHGACLRMSKSVDRLNR